MKVVVNTQFQTCRDNQANCGKGTDLQFEFDESETPPSENYALRGGR